MVKLSIGYPDSEEQVEILRRHKNSDPIESLTPVTDRDSIVEIQNYLGSVKIADDILKYMVALCDATRTDPLIEYGVSPRGLIALSRMVRACAILSERDYVVPADVATVFGDVCSHRIIMRPRAKLEGMSARAVLDEILKKTSAPAIGRK